MKYDNIISAVFRARPNRFIAEVTLDGGKGENIVVHVKNTGRCQELLVPGCTVYLTAPGTPGRKTKYDLVAVEKPENGLLVNMDSQAPNKVVAEWLAAQGFDVVIPEYRYGDSRIDFYMEGRADEEHAGEEAERIAENEGEEAERIAENEGEEAERTAENEGEKTERATEEESKAKARAVARGNPRKKFLMEVKGCTLEVDGVGYFPDAPTERGVKHLRELTRAAKEGYHAILAFVIQMDGVEEVRPNVDTHPEFGQALEEAKATGVEIRYLCCHVEPNELRIIAEGHAT